MRALMLLPLVGFGCSGSGVPNSTDRASAVLSGVYRVDVQTNVDNCEPNEFAGSAGATVLVNRLGVGFNIAIPESSDTWRRVDLLTRGNFVHEEEREFALCGTTTVHENIELQSANAKLAAFSLIEDWNVQSPCESQVSPHASCHSDRTMVYTLVHTCANTSVQFIGPDGHLDCN
jgi:hypothetical protein